MKGLLKFITCGSVDDGKSTLIGHILYDAKLLYTDQEKALELDSKVGSRGGAIDYSLLLDGLMAERERESPLMLHTVILQQITEASLLQIHPDMKNIQETWQWVRPLQIWQLSWWMLHREYWYRQDVMQESAH